MIRDIALYIFAALILVLHYWPSCSIPVVVEAVARWGIARLAIAENLRP